MSQGPHARPTAAVRSDGRGPGHLPKRPLTSPAIAGNLRAISSTEARRGGDRDASRSEGPGDMRRAVLAVAGAAILWSTGGLFIKLAPMPGAWAVALRPVAHRCPCSTWRCCARTCAPLAGPPRRPSRPASSRSWRDEADHRGQRHLFWQYTGPAYVLILSPFLLDEPFRPSTRFASRSRWPACRLFFVGKVEAGQTVGNLLAIASECSSRWPSSFCAGTRRAAAAMRCLRRRWGT